MPCVSCVLAWSSVGTFHFTVPACQRDKKTAKGLPIFQIGGSTCQKACQFLNFVSQKACQFLNYFLRENTFNFSIMVDICKFQKYLENSRKFISRNKEFKFWHLLISLYTWYTLYLLLLVYHVHHKSGRESMHHVNWLGTTLRTIVLENLVMRNRRKHNHNKFSYNYLGSPTRTEHSLRRS